MASDNREYSAFIGDRVLFLAAPNVWSAAERAAVHFRNSTVEGLKFFRGERAMEVWRVGMDRPVFSGVVSKWLSAFRAQRRRTNRWDRLVEEPAEVSR